MPVHKVTASSSPRGLITVRSRADFDLEEVVRRWDDNGNLLKYGVGALVHRLLDTIDGHSEVVQILDDAPRLDSLIGPSTTLRSYVSAN